MSEQVSPTTTSSSQDENQNKDTPTKRTPSKRRSHIERIQEESKELLKNMGIEELADTRSSRRTRSSTKQTPTTPVTPPTPKRTPITPNSSRRGRKKEESATTENNVDSSEPSSPKVPPRKRQKLSETIKEEEEKEIKSEGDNKIDDKPAVSESINEKIAESTIEDKKENEKKDQVDASQTSKEDTIGKDIVEDKMDIDEPVAEGKKLAPIVEEKPAEVAESTSEETSTEKVQEPLVVEEKGSLPEKSYENEAEVASKEPEKSVEPPVEAMEVDSSSTIVSKEIKEPETVESDSRVVESKDLECAVSSDKKEGDEKEASSSIEKIESIQTEEKSEREESVAESSPVEEQVNQIESTTNEPVAVSEDKIDKPMEPESSIITKTSDEKEVKQDESLPPTENNQVNAVEIASNPESAAQEELIKLPVSSDNPISSSNETKIETSQGEDAESITKN